MNVNNNLGDAVKHVSKEGVAVSFHITPSVLSFTLAFLTALVTFILYLSDKPSRAETKQIAIDQQKPLSVEIHAIGDNVIALRNEFHEYVKITIPKAYPLPDDVYVKPIR